MNAEFGGHLPLGVAPSQESLGTTVLRPAAVNSATCGLSWVRV